MHVKTDNMFLNLAIQQEKQRQILLKKFNHSKFAGALT